MTLQEGVSHINGATLPPGVSSLSEGPGRGFCLSSQQLRQRIVDGGIRTSARSLVLGEDGRFRDKDLESRIQPASLDTMIGDQVFILDTEQHGLLRPSPDKTVYRSLLELPRGQRRDANIADGFELKRGFTYLFPLEERVTLAANEHVKASPKSSRGRVFLDTRLLADFNPSYDQVTSAARAGEPVQTWLLVQPLAFNAIVRPGLSLMQLRMFTGDARLSADEVLAAYARQAILLEKQDDGTLTPAAPLFAVNEGLELHLDARGRHSQGIVGLRARRNPDPIDLARKGAYTAEDYFEPVRSDELAHIRPGEHYLLSSKEVFGTPADLSIELRSTSSVGLRGPLHFAGFVDNGFEGDLVFEVRSDELANVPIIDGMPMSTLDVFRTGMVPDKVYGSAQTGSSYQRQYGPRPANNFKGFDYADAARNYKKMARSVLVQDARELLRHRRTPEGFEPITPAAAGALEETIRRGFYQSRYDCEGDELVLQPIPYIVIFNQKGDVFTYRRAENKTDYGDERLFKKVSIGVGGHINREDCEDPIARSLRRELDEEISVAKGRLSAPRLVGTLMERLKPVDRVHFGLVHVAYATGKVRVKENALKDGRFMPQDVLAAWTRRDTSNPPELETWSSVLATRLPELYELGR